MGAAMTLYNSVAPPFSISSVTVKKTYGDKLSYKLYRKKLEESKIKATKRVSFRIYNVWISVHCFRVEKRNIRYSVKRNKHYLLQF